MASKDKIRIVIFAENRRDADSTKILLRERRIDADSFVTVEETCEALLMGASTLILTKEVLSKANFDEITKIISEQPKWSHLPVILLIEPEDIARHPNILDVLSPLGNLTLLEKPIRVSTLMSAVRNCIGDRKRQYEVRELLLNLENARAEAMLAKESADRANKSKSEFLANMSHEIRTPLGAILGFTDLMSRPEISTFEREDFANIVKRNGQLLGSLIDDILDLVKVESGNMTIERIDSSLSEILSDVIAAMQMRSEQKGIPIIINKKGPIQNFIKTDPVRLKQILINLVGNALKFTSKGQITVNISGTEPNPLTNKGRLFFEVIDTGIGIEEKSQQKLFQAFSQADSSITRKFGGTGLGLILSRRLARILGGDLSLKSSAVNEGSIFEFSIQYEPTVNYGLLNTNATALNVSHLRGMNVLVADDSPDNQTLLRLLLSREGVKVTLASDGEEAVSKAFGDSFDAVLMDIQMPKLSGLDAVVELRSKGYSRPVIALSGHAMAEDRDKGILAGCDAYLTKPVNVKELLSTLKRFVN